MVSQRFDSMESGQLRNGPHMATVRDHAPQCGHKQPLLLTVLEATMIGTVGFQLGKKFAENKFRVKLHRKAFHQLFRPLDGAHRDAFVYSQMFVCYGEKSRVPAPTCSMFQQVL